jgi:hypothetical protein
MTVGVVIGRSPRPSELRSSFFRAGAPSLMGRIREVLGICSRASAAAHLYEELSTLSDEALADRGLTRADLPAAAFEELTEGS